MGVVDAHDDALTEVEEAHADHARNPEGYACCVIEGGEEVFFHLYSDEFEVELGSN